MKANVERVTSSTKSKDLILKVVVLIVALIAACTVRFTVSIADLEGTSHSNMWMGVSFLAGIVGGIIYRKDFFVAGFVSTVGFAIAIVLRIVYDLTFVDPTSHNLFPIELVFWSIMAFIPAIAGSFLSTMVFRIINKSRTEKKVTKGNS